RVDGVVAGAFIAAAKEHGVVVIEAHRSGPSAEEWRRSHDAKGRRRRDYDAGVANRWIAIRLTLCRRCHAGMKNPGQARVLGDARRDQPFWRIPATSQGWSSPLARSMRQLSLKASPWSKREVLATPRKVRVATVLSASSSMPSSCTSRLSM